MLRRQALSSLLRGLQQQQQQLLGATAPSSLLLSSLCATPEHGRPAFSLPHRRPTTSIKGDAKQPGGLPHQQQQQQRQAHWGHRWLSSLSEASPPASISPGGLPRQQLQQQQAAGGHLDATWLAKHVKRRSDRLLANNEITASRLTLIYPGGVQKIVPLRDAIKEGSELAMDIVQLDDSFPPLAILIKSAQQLRWVRPGITSTTSACLLFSIPPACPPPA